MPTANDIIVHSLANSQMILNRFTGDLTPPEYLHRITPEANCPAWLIGHLILTERGALGVLGVTDLPTLPQGFEQRFGREGGAPQARDFGDVTQLMPLFNQHRQRLIDAVTAATPQQLDRPLETPRPIFKTAGELASFMGQHVMMHAGQITIMRRSLGRPPMM